MPTVNVYVQTEHLGRVIHERTAEFAAEIARCLSTPVAALDETHISMRIFKPAWSTMIAPIEVEIAAHAYVERVDRQDEICGQLRAWLEGSLGLECRVWLALSQLGYGYKQRELA